MLWTESFLFRGPNIGFFNPLFDSISLVPWPSFSSACLGSCPRFEASHWKGIHLLPLSKPHSPKAIFTYSLLSGGQFKFVCVALTGTLYSQKLGLFIIIHARDQKSALMGNGLYRSSTPTVHRDACSHAAPTLLPRLCSPLSVQLCLGSTRVLPIGRLSTLRSLKQVLPVPAAEMLSKTHTGSTCAALALWVPPLSIVTLRGLSSPDHGKFEKLPRRL